MLYQLQMYFSMIYEFQMYHGICDNSFKYIKVSVVPVTNVSLYLLCLLEIYHGMIYDIQM